MSNEEKKWIFSQMAPCINCGVLCIKTELKHGKCIICNKSKAIEKFRRRHTPNFQKI